MIIFKNKPGIPLARFFSNEKNLIQVLNLLSVNILERQKLGVSLEICGIQIM